MAIKAKKEKTRRKFCSEQLATAASDSKLNFFWVSLREVGKKEAFVGGWGFLLKFLKIKLKERKKFFGHFKKIF